MKAACDKDGTKDGLFQTIFGHLHNMRTKIHNQLAAPALRGCLSAVSCAPRLCHEQHLACQGF